jgi:hypothetical protein
VEPECLLLHSQVPATHPSETGIGAVGNKKVTSIHDPQYQPLDWEASISSWWQQVSWKLQIKWSPVLRPEPVTRRLLHFVLTFLAQFGHTIVSVLWGVFIMGHPCCCEGIFSFLLWNCSFFYMCNINYSILLLRFSFYICMYWCVSCNLERYYTVWVCLKLLLHYSFHCGSLVSCIRVERNATFCYAHHFICKCCVFNFICI